MSSNFVSINVDDEFVDGNALRSKIDAFCIASNKNILLKRAKSGDRRKVFKCNDCDMFSVQVNRGRTRSSWRVTEVKLEHHWENRRRYDVSVTVQAFVSRSFVMFMIAINSKQ